MKSIKKKEMIFFTVGIIVYAVLLLGLVLADPIPPSTIQNVSKSTMGATNSAGYNVSYTGNATHAGGYIFTINIQSKVQDKRWKAFVGNVTGSLTLDDGDGYTIYDWGSPTSASGGEVFATRWPTAVNWANINCTWGYQNASNRTIFDNENTALSFTTNADKINNTFNDTMHPSISIGSISIPANSCFSTKTYNASSKHATDVFTEMMLYDGTNATNGKIIYATIIDTSNHAGYRNDSTTSYDFQLIVPENASTSSSGTLPYYFYVELE